MSYKIILHAYKYRELINLVVLGFISAMSLFGSFMVLLLILVEVAPPTAASIPKLGKYDATLYAYGNS